MSRRRRGRGRPTSEEVGIELRDITDLPSTRIHRLDRQICDTQHQLDANVTNALLQQCTLQRVENEHGIAQSAKNEAERLLDSRALELGALKLQPGELEGLQRTLLELEAELQQVDSQCNVLEGACGELRRQNDVLQARV